jgi:sugar (pentulose or hexulose) kinase
VANPRSAIATGAAFAAFLALGEIRLDDIAALVKLKATHQPDETRRRVYDQQFREFLEFYRRMKPLYKRLNSRAHAA